MMLALVTSPAAADPRTGSAPVDESDLVLRAIHGDHPALLALYRAHQHRIRAFGRRVLGDEIAADDLLHEMFLVLPRILRSYRGQGSVGSFLLGAAAHRAKHHARSARRRYQAEAAAAEEPPGSSPTPERAVQRSELADRLAAALDELPLDQRIAFVLCEVEERTSVEVAAMLSERDGTIRARLMLAKKKLREALSRAPGGCP